MNANKKKFSQKSVSFILFTSLPFYFLLCCPPCSMATTMPSKMMSCFTMTQMEGSKTRDYHNAPDVCKCECKNIVVLNDNSPEKFDFSKALKNDHSKFLTIVLLYPSNLDLLRAFKDESPPTSLQKSVPSYILNHVLRL